MGAKKKKISKTLFFSNILHALLNRSIENIIPTNNRKKSKNLNDKTP
jgi:hypothetical protein